MAANDLDEQDILDKFDNLVALGIIIYGPSKPVRLSDEGFEFEFRICPSWSGKPLTVDDVLSSPESLPKPEKFGPGSDIFRSHPDQVIKTIRNTHVLALNIFPVFRPQYLLLTLDSFRSQNEPLNLQDFEASWEFLESTTVPHFMMYNCTKEAGCSRYHKHMQILKKPEVINHDKTGFRFFPDADIPEQQIPYIHFVHFFEAGALKIGESLLRTYLELLKKCRRTLGIHEDDFESLCPHNVLLTREWIAVIPRRLGNFEGLGANSAGMMGMPTVSSESVFQAWKNTGPVNVFRQLGVPYNGLN